MAIIITSDGATNNAPTRRPLLKLLACLCVGLTIGIIGYIYGGQLFARLSPAPTIILATQPAGTAPRATQPAARQPIAAPALTFDQVNATSIAIYQATAQAVEAQPVPNTDNLPADAPLPSFGSRVNDRAPAGDNVPTAEPQTNDQFGTKQKEPINIQETHTCLHGAVWTDTGCQYPTP